MSLLNEQKRNALIARIHNLNPDAEAQWGKMNSGQALCHLSDQFRGMFGETETTHLGNFMMKTVVRFLAVHVIAVPKNVKTLPEYDQEKKGTQPTDFDSDRATLISYIERFAYAPADHKWPAHGAFGALSRREWDKLAYKHINHHLKQFGA
jgi:hypothetical protein